MLHTKFRENWPPQFWRRRFLKGFYHDRQESPMLHTKFRRSRPVGSGEEDFLRVFTIWAWWPSWSCDQHHVIRF